MNKIISITLILFLSLLSSPSWSETLTMDDLIERNDLFYQKFTNTPFTGEISGMESGKLIKGKKNGEWFTYTPSGQLKSKVYYKKGEVVGLKGWYSEDGLLEFKGNYKDGKKEGLWE